MSKIKTKELIVCVITLAILVLSIFTDVFATESNIFNELIGNNSNVQNIQNENVAEISNRGANNIQNKTNNTANNVANNKNNTNKEATIPNTGVDYSILLVVVVCGISAIYAYKKINDYKNF